MWSLLLLLASLSSSALSWRTCIVPHGPAGTDDSLALNALIPNCSTNAEILFEKGVTYNISTPVNFGNLTSVQISILGNLDLPAYIPYVQSLVNATASKSLYWFTIAGSNVTLQGSTEPEQGWVYWHGYNWWLAASLVQPGGLALRPHGWKLSFSNSIIRHLKISKPIGWQFSTSGSNLHIHDITLDASYDLNTPSIFPFNTDGFDVSGSNILFERLNITNGDDAVAVNSGAHNVTVRDSFQNGGHGYSVSAGGNVANILFNNITSYNSLYATRFKSSLNAVGNITNVTWSNIHIRNATFPIFATSIYVDQNTNRGKTPSGPPANSTSTHISNFSWINVTGTINDVYPGDGSCITVPCWYAIQNISSNPAVTFQLLNQTARAVTVQNVHLTPIDGKGAAQVSCDPTSFTDGGPAGFVCRDGPYVAQ